MDESPSSRNLIMQLLREKAMLKKQVYEVAAGAFNDLKDSLLEIRKDLERHIKKVDGKIPIDYRDNGDFQATFDIVDDSIVFIFHSNVFTFDHNHRIWNLSYVKEHPENSYCGKIYVYNFLSDSFRFNRVNDVGYLIARIFINREGHFFVEGKRQLGFLYNNFENDVLDKDKLRSILESTILYSLDFELFTPPYEQVKEITVQDIISEANRINIATGKRLGFRFQADEDSI